MLSRLIRKGNAKSDGGFTLIELLVVVIIIAILAGIAIPMYLKQREKGWHAAAQSDLRNAAVAMESYYTDESTYATATLLLLGVQGYNQSSDVRPEITAQSDTGYTMTAYHINDDTCIYTFNSADGEPVGNLACTD